MALNRVLIANRGEVALRILRAARESGFSAVVVASESDYGSLAARSADRRILLPGKTLQDTYLNGEAIVKAAKQSEASCIHPGFGFLSEDPSFARLVQSAGLIWIGPSPTAMEAMSSKVAAKERAARLGIPVLPSIRLVETPDAKALSEIANLIGFPCLIKAEAGGGGKGHRVVESQTALAENLAAAQREAKNAFGNPAVFVERLIQKPRHVEIQIMGDAGGKVQAFGERDCSMQRRFQKIVEESPAPWLTPEQRTQLETLSCSLATDVGYQNAGTVEFLQDAVNGQVYFMEMNTRLQVEHGVTEERYGIDLVRMQFAVAFGEPIDAFLPKRPPTGHVIELRLYAEDPSLGFFPQAGRLEHLTIPPQLGLRVECGVESGDQITDQYDPMIAKLVLKGSTREEAISACLRSLQSLSLLGPTTNRDFLQAALRHPEFAQGGFDTGFIARHFQSFRPAAVTCDLAAALAAWAAFGNETFGADSAQKMPKVFQSSWGREAL